MTSIGGQRRASRRDSSDESSDSN